jgi:hypothetical protein
LEIYQRSLKNRKIKPSSISEIATPTAQESEPATPLPNLAELYKAGSQIGQMGDVAPHQGTWTPVVPPIQGAAPKQYNEFESWYLDQFGEEYNGNFSASKPDDMDYNTWQTGQTLYNLYNTEKQAGEAYGQRIGAIDKQADYQNQQAYILAQKLMKYLGLTASAQGQKGIAAGNLIAAQTDYQNRLAGIATTAEGYRQDAVSGKQTALSTAKSQAQQSLAEIYGRQAQSDEQRKLLEEQSQAQEETRVGMQTAAEQEQWYYIIDNVINQKLGPMQVANEDTGAYSYEDWQSLWNIYEVNKGKLSESQQQIMEFYLKNIDHEDEIEVGEEETSSANGSGMAGQTINGWVVTNDNKIKVSDEAQKTLKNGATQRMWDMTFVYYNGYWYPAKKA